MHLVVPLRKGEALAIGEHIGVTLLAVNGHEVRFGVTAPAEVPVRREEAHERRRRHSQQKPA